MNIKGIFNSVKLLNEELKIYNTPSKNDNLEIEDNLFDLIIKDEELKKVTKKLFFDGHYAQAVEAAYKKVNNTIKKISGEKKRDGADLMTYVFSENHPIIKLNDMSTKSELDEQKGFMQIFAGCMTGIRNPRAHEEEWADTERNALYLISFADYLLQRIKNLDQE